MVKMPLRRSDEQTAQEERAAVQTDNRTDPALAGTRTDQRRRLAWRRNRSADFSTRIEQAAERAAAATRTAAAVAAAERARSPRTSALASLALVVSVVAALAVATGVLAGLGVAIGIVAALLGLGGLAASGRRFRYVSGRTEATLALLIAIGAIVIGSLALAGNLSWLDTDTDQVARLRDALPGWLT
jgi:hypothetical protein